LGGPDDEKAYDLSLTPDGGYAIGGYTRSYGSGSLDFLLATFDSLGNSCSGEFVTPIISDVLPIVTSISPTIDSVSPIVGEPSLTVNSPGPTVWVVCGTGPAVLACSLWTEPDTLPILLEEEFYVYMRVENRGFSDADSVEPHTIVFGDENVVLVAGPDPTQASVGFGDDVVFTWTYSAEDTGSAYWTGYTTGKDDWSDTIVTSEEATSNEVTIELLERFKRADADGDMGIQMSDAVFTLQYLYVPGSPTPECMDAADADDDGELVMSDALFTLKYLYVPGSPAPLSPFPHCGADPTMDEIRCLRHPCTVPFIRGDCTGDTVVDLVDVFYMLEYVEHGDPVPLCLDAADVDDDGGIDTQDASYLSDYLTGGGPEPPAPFPECGVDPTGDELGCTESPCTE
jgi:hypothetical protein